MIRNQRGLALIEVMIAAAVLGILVMGWISFEANTQREIQKTITRSKVQKLLLIIQTDILKNDRFIPPREPIAALEDPGLTGIELEKELAKTFDEPTLCYTDGGAPTETVAKDCYFRVSYYKMRIRDRGYPSTSELSYIPLSRINIRVEFEQRGHSDTEKTEKIVRYFSRLSTQIAAY